MPFFKRPNKQPLDPTRDVSHLSLNVNPVCPTKKNMAVLDPPKMSERLEKFIPPVFRIPEEEKERKERQEWKKKRVEMVPEWAEDCWEEGCEGVE